MECKRSVSGYYTLLKVLITSIPHNISCTPYKVRRTLFPSYLRVPAVFVYQGYDGADVLLLDNIQCLGTVHQHAVQNIQDPCKVPDSQ